MFGSRITVIRINRPIVAYSKRTVPLEIGSYTINVDSKHPVSGGQSSV
jgi:hypothetical protein